MGLGLGLRVSRPLERSLPQQSPIRIQCCLLGLGWGLELRVWG